MGSSSEDDLDLDSESSLSSESEVPIKEEKEEIVVKEYRTESNNPTAKEDDESVSSKAKKSGRLLKELVSSLASKAESTTKEKTAELKQQAAKADSTDDDSASISNLGSLLDKLTRNFDDTMDYIGNAPYDEQQDLLVGYKKVLSEELNVVNARLALAKRLTPLSSTTVALDTEAV
jgi:hypothetical protein